MTKSYIAILAACSALVVPQPGAAQASRAGAPISQDVADCFVAGTCDFEVANAAEQGDACLNGGTCAVGDEKLVVLVKPRAAAARTGRTQANLAVPATRNTVAARPAQRARLLPKACTPSSAEALNMCLGFGLGSAELTSAAKSQVRVFATALKNNPTSGTFTIEGHTDSSGTVEQNEVLSRKRAESVLNYLVGQGVPAARLKAEGHGFAKPRPGLAASNSLNRRVEIVRN